MCDIWVAPSIHYLFCVGGVANYRERFTEEEGVLTCDCDREDVSLNENDFHSG